MLNHAVLQESYIVYQATLRSQLYHFDYFTYYLENLMNVEYMLAGLAYFLHPYHISVMSNMI